MLASVRCRHHRATSTTKYRAHGRSGAATRNPADHSTSSRADAGLCGGRSAMVVPTATVLATGSEKGR